MSESAGLQGRFDAPWHHLPTPALQLGESPRFAHGQLRWVDINTRTLYVVNIDSMSIFEAGVSVSAPGIRTMAMPDQIACILPTVDADNWIGCGREGIWNIRNDGKHALLLPAPFDSTWQRFNDGCCDEWGRIWISSLIDDKRAPLAKLWCLKDGVLHESLTGITTGNGLAYSAAHRKLWFADTFARCIRRYDVNPHSTALMADGWSHTYTRGTERPDGACMLDENHYAVAVIEGHRLDVFNMDNTQAAYAIAVSASKPTMPCILPKPASALVLATAAVAASSTVNANASHESTDGYVLVKAVSSLPHTTHVYLPAIAKG